MARAKRSPLVTVLAWFFVLVGAVFAAATAASDQYWLADMVTFFQPQLALGMLVMACMTLLMRRWLAALALSAMAAYCVLPLLLTANPMAPAGVPPTLRVVSANLLFDNASPERFSEAVATLSPDIIVVQEARHDWPDALRSLPGYPHILGQNLYRWNSNMVLSRYPMRGRLLGDPSQGERVGGGPAIRAEIDLPGRATPLVVYAVHAPTPRTLAGWQSRSVYLEQVAQMISAEPAGSEIVLAGDWNTPVWSPAYARMLQASGLEATERSAWPEATRLFWRTEGVTLVGSPIDHVAVSGEIAVADHFLGPDFGSDHLPVVVDLKLP
jgi:endonuclease/exonuclease/phosphatase (EEP) superfamily protein YafD